MPKVSIIGGGVIGLCTAYFLSEQGYTIDIFDANNMQEGCSYGNAGMIVPSHIIPLAQPGMITQGVKWMFDNKSPFYVAPRLNMDLIKWGWKFYKAANKKHVAASIPALRDISLLSKKLYQELHKKHGNFFYEEKGLLMLYKTEKVGKDVIHEGEVAKQNGLDVDFLTKEQIPKLENGTAVAALGAVHYKCDAHIYPQKFMALLKSNLQQKEAAFYTNTKVLDIRTINKKATAIVTKNKEYHTDAVVIASGAWAPTLAKKIGSNISLLPGKGYSFTLPNLPERPSIPTILCEGKVAVTPMDNLVRFGGTMEITNTKNINININRLLGIVESINSFYPNMQVAVPTIDQVWYGFRPCTPTGLPIISRHSKFSNIAIAVGHGMMGLSLGPATGKLIEEIILEKPNSINTKMFSLTP